MRVVYTVFTTVFTVFTYEGVYTVFTYEGVYTAFTFVFTVFTYEGVYCIYVWRNLRMWDLRTLFCACGICANGICAIVPYHTNCTGTCTPCMSMDCLVKSVSINQRSFWILNTIGSQIQVERAVLERLVGYVTQVSDEASATKDFTVFADLLDENPTLRSYLLQLVLRHGMDDGLFLIDQFLTRTEMVIANSKSSNIRAVRDQMHNMVVQCIEQAYWSHQNSASIKIEHPLQLPELRLREAATELLSSESLVSTLSKLSSCAKIRYGFEAVADYIYNQISSVQSGLMWFLIVLQLCTAVLHYKWTRVVVFTCILLYEYICVMSKNCCSTIDSNQWRRGSESGALSLSSAARHIDFH